MKKNKINLEKSQDEDIETVMEMRMTSRSPLQNTWNTRIQFNRCHEIWAKIHKRPGD